MDLGLFIYGLTIGAGLCTGVIVADTIFYCSKKLIGKYIHIG